MDTENNKKRYKLVRHTKFMRKSSGAAQNASAERRMRGKSLGWFSTLPSSLRQLLLPVFSLNLWGIKRRLLCHLCVYCSLLFFTSSAVLGITREKKVQMMKYFVIFAGCEEVKGREAFGGGLWRNKYFIFFSAHSFAVVVWLGRQRRRRWRAANFTDAIRGTGRSLELVLRHKHKFGIIFEMADLHYYL